MAYVIELSTGASITELDDDFYSKKEAKMFLKKNCRRKQTMEIKKYR